MKFIVTGGAGFIGSHLTEKLVNNNHDVTVIDNFSIGKKKNLKNIINKIKLVKADIRNFKQIEKLFGNVDCVFHLAALADIVPSIDNPDAYYSTNVNGTYNVIKLSVLNKVKSGSLSESDAVNMIEDAKKCGADGVVNIRFMTSVISQGAAEVLAYGTAVTFE